MPSFQLALVKFHENFTGMLNLDQLTILRKHWAKLRSSSWSPAVLQVSNCKYHVAGLVIVIVTRKLPSKVCIFFILCIIDGILVNIFKRSLNIIFPQICHCINQLNVLHAHLPFQNVSLPDTITTNTLDWGGGLHSPSWVQAVCTNADKFFLSSTPSAGGGSGIMWVHLHTLYP